MNRQSIITTSQLFCSLWREILLAVVFLLSVFVPTYVEAAQLTFSPASGTYEEGKTFTVRVQIATQGDPVNSSDGVIKFDQNLLSVVSVSDDSSAFNLWVTEPEFSNGAGTITYAGGATRALSGTQNVLNISFRGKAQGQATVSVREGKILAGAGQDVTGEAGTATYTIGPAQAAPAPTPTTTTEPERTAGPPPPAPRRITSETHPDPKLWYATSTASFEWEVTYGITAVRTGISQDATSTPEVGHEPPIATISYDDVPDGVSYFSLAFQNRNGWSDPTQFVVQIDTVPPEPFELSAEGGDLMAILRFETSDELSGIENYRILVDELEVDTVVPGDIIDGAFDLLNLQPGDHEIVVIAFDKAGNSAEASASVTVTGELPGAEEDEEEGPGIFGPVWWVSMIFMILLSIAVGIIIFERKKHAEEKDRIKIEAIEAGERLVNIFDVLREEVEEKILVLAHKPNMTDNERSILQGLKDALDVSEELLDKEIEDVRKLVK